jgi:hypothetical protein
MDIDEIIWTDLQLVPDTVRHSEQFPITDVISVGQPFVIDAIKYMKSKPAQALDPAIKLLQNSDAFSYARLPISIRSKDQFEIRFLSMEVKIISEANKAKCWSMDPMRVEDPIKLTTKATFSGGLKLQTAELGPSLGNEREYIIYQPQIEAFGLGEINPGWEFRPTKGRRLNGIQLLHLVVHRPNRINAMAEVSMKADIFERGLLWNYRARSRKDSDVVISFSLVS